MMLSMPRHTRLLELARHGARARFQELVKELDALTTAFPDLSKSFDDDELPIKFLIRRGASRRLGKKRTISPEGRRRIAEAQRKRWAAKKAAAKK
jgi:hypothetical protein